ncbi:MAG TPA: ABC transporter permease [Candidatus Binataceae bacterium]|nr:ABC transporter permease [Candidatus Binataceae bacterium]
MNYELQIALRYLRARRRDAFISITTIFTAVGVMLGVAALIIVLAVMRGFEVSLRQRILSLTPQVEIQSVAGGIGNYAEIQARTDRLKGVAGSDPFIIGQGMASSARGLSGVFVRGVEPANPVVVERFSNYIRDGSLGSLAHSDPANDGTIAIGATLAEKLKVKVGDPINLVVPIMAGKDAELTTRTGHFIVGAIFETGVVMVDRDLMFTGLDRAQKFFGREGRADGIEVRLGNLDDTAAVTIALRAMLGKDFHVGNWMEYNQAAVAGFELLKRVYAIVLLMLIGVAAFNLVATLIMVVMEKRKDIAVLMAMGATPAGVRRIFLLKGLIVGSIGTAAGLTIGALGCFSLAHYHFIHIEKKIYGIATLPIDANPLSFVIVALASIALCWIAAVYPARQAARELPVAIFRS